MIRNDSDGNPFTAASLAEAVADGDYRIAVVFPAGFTDALADPGVLLGGGGATVRVELITDPAASLQTDTPVSHATSAFSLAGQTPSSVARTVPRGATASWPRLRG